MHIFLVDEDRDELKFFLEAMAGLIPSFKCTYATSSEQAVEMLKYLTPDFIFVDNSVSDSSGLNVLEAAKRNERLKDIPFILYSENIADDIRGEALAMGVVACLERPGSITELTELLRDYLQPVPVGRY